jgi:dTMP kinase
MNGRFYSFDGPDGGGKSTQATWFAEWLEGRGRRVVRCRDPGSTPLGERLREIVLERSELAIGMRAEMLLYMAARAQLVEAVIRPALEAGADVVSDRFLLANVVYQGHAGGLDPAELWEVGRAATGGLAPDRTFVLDVSPEEAARRMRRPWDRVEDRGAAYRERVRAGYLAEAARAPERIVVIDASRPAEAVQAVIRKAAGLAAE